MAFLKAPKLNPECKAGLKNNSIVKRDEYNSQNQSQVGIALCALGEAISDLLKPTIQSSLGPEARLAVTKVSEGTKILADLFYRLSLTRRAQITPVLNLVAKNTADTIPVDDFLFGTSFGEEMKKANSIEKSSRDIVRVPLTISRKVQQPIKQPTQSAPRRSGNAHAPVRSSRTATTRRTGASSNSRRASYRPRSHSRRR